MRKIIAITQLTLDGVMQSPGGKDEDPSNGFEHGGWAMKYPDKEDDKVISDLINHKFEMLLGRRTYDIFAGFWPKHNDDPIGKAFNNAKKYVATKTLDQLDWEYSHRIGLDVVQEVRQLKEAVGPEIHIWGSGNLLQTLIRADLIDEYQFWTFPVMLGEGKRLFEKGVPPRGLKLVKSRSTGSGVVLSTYRFVGELPK